MSPILIASISLLLLAPAYHLAAPLIDPSEYCHEPLECATYFKNWPKRIYREEYCHDKFVLSLTTSGHLCGNVTIVEFVRHSGQSGPDLMDEREIGQLTFAGCPISSNSASEEPHHYCLLTNKLETVADSSSSNDTAWLHFDKWSIMTRGHCTPIECDAF